MDACLLEPAEKVFVARQPIFDAEEQVWGYELLFRASEAAAEAGVVDAAAATSTVIVDGFSLWENRIWSRSWTLSVWPRSMCSVCATIPTW